MWVHSGTAGVSAPECETAHEVPQDSIILAAHTPENAHSRGKSTLCSQATLKLCFQSNWTCSRDLLEIVGNNWLLLQFFSNERCNDGCGISLSPFSPLRKGRWLLSCACPWLGPCPQGWPCSRHCSEGARSGPARGEPQEGKAVLPAASPLDGRSVCLALLLPGAAGPTGEPYWTLRAESVGTKALLTGSVCASVWYVEFHIS